MSTDDCGTDTDLSLLGPCIVYVTTVSVSDGPGPWSIKAKRQ